MTASPSMVCTGCGAVVAGPMPFRCPGADGDGVDHVLARADEPTGAGEEPGGDAQPFLRYRSLAYSWQLARSRGLSDSDYVGLAHDLDRAVADVCGHGFAVTPYRESAKLSGILGLDGEGVWIKDETGNVAGSHKARHLFGLALHLAVVERTGLIGASEAARPLAIASCGNAALAAAVVARAARRPLRVFVPTWADPGVIERLGELGAAIETCRRRETDPPGDPCHRRFREAVRKGALPFTCQGSENGLTIDGGMTLGFELASQSAGNPITRLVIQVGGGALASSVVQGFARARDLGLVSRVPVIHAVQTAGGFPLIRAWRRVARALARDLGEKAEPAADQERDPEAARADATAARALAKLADAAAIDHAVQAAARERARYMWPWESEPTSLATGILDDETYDWLAVVRGMLRTGGWPVVASEAAVLEAYCEGRGAGIIASATGTAGLAGAMTLARAGGLDPHDRVALLFTGVDR